MKPKYKKLAGPLMILLGLIVVFGTSAHEALPDWANTTLILLAGALIVIVGTLLIIQVKPE